MKFTKLGPLLAVTAAAVTYANIASAATDERLNETEILKLNECMHMKPDVLAKDAQCTVVLKKASISPTDVERMLECERVMNADVTKNPDCVAMMEKHPELVRGHGRLDTSPPSSTTTPTSAKPPAAAPPTEHPN